ncbi:ARID DNA-binding domain-containing protein, partial [Tanacetum coccineum]
HVIKSCPILIKDETEYAQRHPNDKERINPTLSKIFQDKNMVLCFKCKEYGHIADRCPSKEEQPKFGQEFDAIVEILRLTRNDGEEIKKCYMTYLDIFTSYYKTARAPEVPTNVEEDLESLVSYQWNIGKTCAPIAVQKGKEKLEHFGIKLEEETFCKEQQSAYYGKDQDKYTTYKGPSTSRIWEKKIHSTAQVMITSPFEGQEVKDVKPLRS